MSLRVLRQDDESWRDCVIRYAEPWGLEDECLEIYDEELAKGATEAQAAWAACYEWDVLDFVDDD